MPPPAGMPLLGEVHPDPREIRAGRHDGLAVGSGLVGDPLGFEIADNGARILEREVCVQDAHGGLGHPHDHESEEGNQDKRHRAHCGNPRWAKLRHKVDCRVHRPEPAPARDHWARFARFMVSGWLTMVRS